MEQYDGSVTVVVLDLQACLMAADSDVDTAITMIALVSENPANWDQATSVWDRYRTEAVGDLVGSLPMLPTDRQTAIETLGRADAWVAIDFPNKRIFTGGQFLVIGRDVSLDMAVDETAEQQSPLRIHLPPWWEMHETAEVGLLNQPRKSPINQPHVDRDVLYGDALIRYVAQRVLDAATAVDAKEIDVANKNRELYKIKVAIHRDWLMTPREDLGGRMPRQLLHGAMEWSDRVTWGQRLRFEESGILIAAPDDWPEFATAPMGSQEVCSYFDFCRELIDSAWAWCNSDVGQQLRDDPANALSQLVSFLDDAKNLWLSSPFEDGPPPGFIIQCDRRRVPIGDGVAIEGIEAVPTEQHASGCDCPICEMMADGLFGVGFSSIDGHHLELDGEFAFSMIESRQEWEREQGEFTEFCGGVDRKLAEENSIDKPDDPYASAWSTIKSDDSLPGESSLPGDNLGHLKLAFMVAEIVSELNELQASRSEIMLLNDCFSNYRRGDQQQRPQLALGLKANLQSLADHYPSLISKSADLQSRIDEAERSSMRNDGVDDFPFES